MFIFGAIKNGAIVPEAHYLDEMKKNEGRQVEIRTYVETRTGQQNRLLWELYTHLSAYTGFTKDEVHDVCKRKFLTYEKRGNDGKAYKFTRSTTELDKEEFSQYYERVEQLAAEMGIVLPAL